MKEPSTSNKILRNTIFLYIRMGLVLIVSLYTTRVVLHTLGVEDYGLYNVVCGLVSIFGVLNTTLSSGINRFYNFEIGKNGNVKDVYNAAIRVQFAISLIIILLVEIIGIWYLNEKMVIPDGRLKIANIIFQFSIISLLLSILQTPYSAAILAYEKMDYYALVSIIDVFLKLAFVFLLQLISIDKLLLYGLLNTIISILNFFMYYGYAKKRFIEIQYSKIYNKEFLKSMTTFSFWLMLDPIAYTIRGQGCNMVLNLFRGTILNAAYTISNQIGSAIDQFTGAVSMAFRPQIIQSYSSRDYYKTKALMFRMSKIIFILELALSVPIICKIDYILSIWLGDYPPFTALFTALILIVKTINTLNSPITTVIMAIGNVRYYMILSCIIVSSILPLTYVFLSLGYSPISMYIIMLVLTIINQIVAINVLKRNFDLFDIHDYLVKIVLPCLIQAVVVFVAIYCLSFVLNSTFINLILLVLTSIILSGITSYIFVFDKNEKEIFIQFLNKYFLRYFNYKFSNK